MPDQTLQGFLLAAQENEAESLIEYCELTEYLETVSDAIRKMIGLNPGSPLEGRGVLEAMLLVNAYSLYLAAARIALSGQSPPAFAVLRACLESALYAVIAAQSEDNRTVWYGRDKNREACRKLFTKSEATKYLEKIDPNLADVVTRNYEDLIDLGAHPNVKSVLPHIDVKTVDEGTAATLEILHSIDSTEFRRTIIACIETGSVVLYIGRYALPEYKPADDAYQISTDIYAKFCSTMSKTD